ncbi:MAG: hypothetical protein OXI16_07415 [Chloroflexota bacterium]|nr:hypothetical protein [Chloroflexota bacterium]
MEDISKIDETSTGENELSPSHAHAKENATEQPVEPWPPRWYTNILKRAKEMPQEDRDMFPPDYSENLDHYLYGMPKKTP